MPTFWWAAPHRHRGLHHDGRHIADRRHRGPLTGEGSGGAAEGDLYFGIENIIGTSAADTLIGNAGANVIDAGAGAVSGDIIRADGGDDTVVIGANAATRMAVRDWTGWC